MPRPHHTSPVGVSIAQDMYQGKDNFLNIKITCFSSFSFTQNREFIFQEFFIMPKNLQIFIKTSGILIDSEHLFFHLNIQTALITQKCGLTALLSSTSE